ncbi:MAG: pyridoxal-dependent decarboxylase [Caulobacteraceae bacterium]|nr:pyridoxal-dependent decarboxylase [Caulobacteraceae bacterium]
MTTSLDPSDWEAVRAQGHRMLDDLFDHLSTLREQPVWRPIPQEVRDRFHTAPPAEPTPLSAVYQDYRETVQPYAGGNLHPGFMGWVQGAGTPVGMLAEMLAGGLNANLGGRDHMPIAVERQVAGWMRDLIGFPATAGGQFVTGASTANFIGVLLARSRALGPKIRRKGLAADGRRLTAYTSKGAHACVARALEMAGIGSEALRLIAVDADHRVLPDAMAAAIAEDRAAGLTPFLIVGNAGTVDTGAIDDLTALADLAAAEGLWFHIDGAYGALGVLSAAIATRLAGIERADSLAFDFHKWGHAPYDAGFVLVRDEADSYATFSQVPAYLGRETRGIAAGDWWPCDTGPDLSRGFRALKVWFTLRTLGTTAIGRAIDQGCDLAQALARRIAASDELELLAPVQLNIVCFGYRCADPNRVNATIVADLHEAGAVAPSLTRIDGRAAIRAALFNHRTTEADIRTLIDQTLTFGRRAVQARAA